MAYRRLSTVSDGTKINRKPGMGGRNLSADTYAWNYNLPCLNPNCKSHGRPHPNCQCYGGGGEGDAMAHGGQVCASGLPHHPTCEYYASGGPVAEASPHEDPLVAKGHYGAQSGLLGILNDVGRPRLQDADKHTPHVTKLKQHMLAGEHDKALGAAHGHPTAGSAGQGHLSEIMPQLSGPVMNMEAHPESLRSSVDYLHGAIKGRDRLKSKVDTVFGKGTLRLKPDEKKREELKARLDSINQNPEQMLDIGGHLGHYMPEHSSQVAAGAAQAVTYLNSIKPTPTQGGPLDDVIQPDKASMAAYDRQLDIAAEPLLVLEHTESGTLLPQDVHTLKVIYPGLYGSMVQNAGEAIIDMRSKGKTIPYKKRQALSMLLDQPLDQTMTPTAMQAIMKANGVQQAEQKQRANQKATDVELKQINKVDQMAETNLEARQINRKKD